MTQIVIIDRSGNEMIIEATDGASLMEAIRDHGSDELLALCGGCCSCATCHVYIDGVDDGVLTPLGEDEDDLLDSSDNRRPSSRLSCQILMSGRLAGLRAKIAPED